MRPALFFPVFSLAVLACAQDPDFASPHGRPDREGVDRKLPNGKSQMDEMLKADHVKSLEDLRRITEISQMLATEMERDTSYVLSRNSIKKTEEIERLAKRIRSRMRRY